MIKKLMHRIISESVRNDQGGQALYREPIVGYASAGDPIFSTLKEVAHPDHMMPTDLLPQAKTVFAFFVPFSKEVINGNREGEMASRHWAETYTHTNQLIAGICADLKQNLADQGVRMEWLLPTYQFDKEKLMAHWSHKHAAYACGLGQFGLNHQIITAKGCAGRFGTGVLDVTLDPSARPPESHHCFYHSRGCNFCLGVCPQGAIKLPEGETSAHFSGLDRHACYQHCRQADMLYDDLESVDVCGKCSTGPCAYLD